MVISRRNLKKLEENLFQFGYFFHESLVNYPGSIARLWRGK
jgi:hypothetical protein